MRGYSMSICHTQGKWAFDYFRGKADREFWFKFLRLDPSIKGFAENLHNLWTWLLFLWKIRQNIFCSHLYSMWYVSPCSLAALLVHILYLEHQNWV